jgi:DNA-binding transcriptional LysR family regulator
MIFVSASHYPEPVTADMLSVRHEAYIRWGAEYDEWHHRMFGRSESPKFRISMIEQLTKLLREPQSWAIVPRSVVDAMDAGIGIRRLETAFPLPRRNVSFVTAKAPINQDCIQAFLACLKDQLASWPEIELLEP